MSEAPRPSSVAPPVRADRAAGPHPALAARRRHVRAIRRRVVAVTCALFVAVWGVIGVRLVEGHDPALSAGASKTVATTAKAATSNATATRSTADSSSASDTSTAADTASTQDGSSPSTSSSSTPTAATTRAS